MSTKLKKNALRASARGAPPTLTIQLPRVTFELQAAQQWGLRARDIVEAHDTDVVDAYPVSEKWGFSNSQYLWMERDIEHQGLGVSAHLTRFVAACHVLRHYNAMRDAYATNTTAEFWMRSYYVARHAGTMLRADAMLSARAEKSRQTTKAAQERHKFTQAEKDKAIRLFQEGEYRGVSHAMQYIRPKVKLGESTLRRCLDKYVHATCK